MTIDPRLSHYQATVLHESEFSDLVRQTFERPYSLQQQGDMHSQESFVRFDVPADREEEEHWQAVSMEEWLAATPPDPEDRSMEAFTDRLRWDREFYPQLDSVANELHARGQLDAGTYVLHVWW